MIDFGLSVKPASGLGVPLLARVGSPAYAAPGKSSLKSQYLKEIII